jgi:hypothetical protein
VSASLHVTFTAVGPRRSVADGPFREVRITDHTVFGLTATGERARVGHLGGDDWWHPERAGERYTEIVVTMEEG